MGAGKRKIEIKRKEKGLFKKADELHSKTGANVAVLVFSPAGRPNPHGVPSFKTTIDMYCFNMDSNGGYENYNDMEWARKMELWRSWLETLQVEAYDEAEELLELKRELEDVRGKLSPRDLFPGLIAASV
ncbi:hypothetical protein RJ639_035790 [Escallonia herrerae]|uniref:MADS-box domain-containing protein n=1 Tax=Escallonia herrerae TaxID=1293975 RepID=A0AA88WMY2_9ASTE|nr:hypothetical protein RJ639_035790 [Escallonia herrerae]